MTKKAIKVSHMLIKMAFFAHITLPYANLNKLTPGKSLGSTPLRLVIFYFSTHYAFTP
jgi:hypothetical protein